MIDVVTEFPIPYWISMSFLMQIEDLYKDVQKGYVESCQPKNTTTIIQNNIFSF